MDIQGAATLSRLDGAVEITGAVLGPPFHFQYIHVPVLLELQDSRRQRDRSVRAGINVRKYHRVCQFLFILNAVLLELVDGEAKSETRSLTTLLLRLQLL